MAISTAYLVAGFLLQSTGFYEKLAQQFIGRLFWLRAGEIGLPTILCFASSLLLFRYRSTVDRAYDVKSLLELKRSATPPTP